MYTYIYIYIEREREILREMGGAPRNPAPRNHFWCGLSSHQTATAQMH